MNEPSDQPRDPSLSRLYQANTHGEPPPHLDRAILAAARAAAKPAPSRPTPWWRRLRAPMALAATVMLAVMLTLSIDRNPPQVEEKAAVPAPATRVAPTPSPVGGDTATQAPAPARAEKKAAPAAPAAEAEPKAVAPPARQDATPAPTAQPPSAVAGASAEAEAARTMPPELRRNAAAAANLADRAAKPEAAGPETWLDEIRALRRQGRQAEADRRLQEFRRTFPAYPLPDDLR